MTDKHTNRQRDRMTDKHTNRQRDRMTDKHTNRQTVIERQTEIDKQMYREGNRQTYKPSIDKRQIEKTYMTNLPRINKRSSLFCTTISDKEK
jgi:hypothetical protein